MKNFLKKYYIFRYIHNFIIYFPYYFRFSFIKKKIEKKNVKYQVSKKKNFLLFLPEHGINFYFFIFISIGLILRAVGYEVLFFKCFDNFNFCKLVYNNNNIPKKAICAKCWSSSEKILNFFNFKIISTKNDYNYEKIRRYLNNKNIKFLQNYKYKNIPVGKLAIFDMAILQKINDINNLNKKYLAVYIKIIINCIITIQQVDQLLKKYNFKNFITFEEYSAENSARLYLEKKKVSCYRSSIAYHFNGDSRYIGLTKTYGLVDENYLKNKYWKLYKNLSINKNFINQIFSDLINKISGSGSHNYSPNISSINIYEKLNVNPKKKVITFYPNSNDEIYATKKNVEALNFSFKSRDPYRNIFDCIDHLIKFTNSLNNIHLIIRLHPRIGKTFRDNINSKIYQEYLKRYKNKNIDNTTFVWPEESISSYDIAKISNICITTWGSMSLELARMGIPVIVAMRSIIFSTPGIKLIDYAKSKKDLENQIKEKINYQATLQDFLEVVRWYNLYYLSNTVFFPEFKTLHKNYKNFSFKNVSNPNNLKIFRNLIDGNKRKEIINSNLENLIKFNKKRQFFKRNQEIKSLKKNIQNLILLIKKNYSGNDKNLLILKRLGNIN